MSFMSLIVYLTLTTQYYKDHTSVTKYPDGWVRAFLFKYNIVFWEKSIFIIYKELNQEWS